MSRWTLALELHSPTYTYKPLSVSPVRGLITPSTGMVHHIERWPDGQLIFSTGVGFKSKVIKAR